LAEAQKNQDAFRQLQKRKVPKKRVSAPSSGLDKLTAPNCPRSTTDKTDHKVVKNTTIRRSRPGISKKGSDISAATASTSASTTSFTVKKKDMRTTKLCFQGDSGVENPSTNAYDRLYTAVKTNPDVIIFSEYCWYDQSCGKEKIEEKLRSSGYSLHYASVFATSAIAVKHSVTRVEEVPLNDEHSALFVQVSMPSHEEEVWICSSYLCAYDGDARQEEMKTILGWLESNSNDNAKVIMNIDFPEESCDSLKSDDNTDASITEFEYEDGLFSIMGLSSFVPLSDLLTTRDEDTAKACSRSILSGKSTGSGNSNGVSLNLAVDYTFCRNVQKGTYFESAKEGLFVCDWHF
jgi:hypothetical protein